MKILGITGGVGTGKSVVLSYLKEKKGVVVYEADQIARVQQQPGTVCYDAMIAHFGDGILLDNLELDRKKIGGIVFADESELLALNKIVHPEVRKNILELIEFHQLMGTKLFVMEAAILFEGAYERICDETWYIYADETIRLHRVMESRGYSETQFQQMISHQMSEEKFREHAHKMIENNGDMSCLYEKIEENLKELLGEEHENM